MFALDKVLVITSLSLLYWQDSAVSTLRSELTLEDRQAYLDTHPQLNIQVVTQQQEKITPTTVNAAYTVS